MSDKTKCPICNKDVDPLRARAMGIFGGTQYYFCSPECKAKFADPRKAPRDEAPAEKPAPPPELTQAPRARDSPAKKAKAEAKAAAAAAAVEPPPDPDDEEHKPIKRDPTPSVMEDLGAVQSGAGRVWGLVIVLFAAAGVVLFFALK